MPALLVALGSPEKATRLAALKCVKVVKEVSGNESTVPYALDVIYGPHSGKPLYVFFFLFHRADHVCFMMIKERVQILKPADLTSYLDVILNDEGSLAIDPAHIISVHNNHFTIVKDEPKKNAR